MTVDYKRAMKELGLGDGNGVNLSERIGDTATNTPPAVRGNMIPANDPRNRASPGW